MAESSVAPCNNICLFIQCIVDVRLLCCCNIQNDPYLRIYLGSERLVNDKSNYIPNTVDPVFGKYVQSKLPYFAVYLEYLCTHSSSIYV